jgi:hypothetical protein
MYQATHCDTSKFISRPLFCEEGRERGESSIGTSPYIVVSVFFLRVQQELDINAGINISISYFGTEPSAMFLPESIRDTLEGPIGSQATTRTVSAQVTWVKADISSPGLDFAQELGIRNHFGEFG